MKQIRGYRPIKDSERFRVRYVLPSHRFHKRLVNRGQLLDKIFILSNGIWNERFFETSKFLLWDKKITRFFVRIHFKKFWHSIRSSETRDPHSSVHHRLKPCKKTGNAGYSLNSEFSMAVRNSAGSRIRRTCVCVACARSVNSHTSLNFSIRVTMRVMRFPVRLCARWEFNSSAVQPQGGRRSWRGGGVDHRLPWQPEGKPFHPAGGISRQGRVEQPENPSLHPLAEPFCGFSAKLIPTPRTLHKYPRRWYYQQFRWIKLMSTRNL